MMHGVSYCVSVFVSCDVVRDYRVKIARHGTGRAQVAFAL